MRTSKWTQIGNTKFKGRFNVNPPKKFVSNHTSFFSEKLNYRNIETDHLESLKYCQILNTRLVLGYQLILV